MLPAGNSDKAGYDGNPTLIIPTLGSLSQEDLEFKTNLGYSIRLC